jgi:GMP synthase-like glutamine amidotransferase
LPWIQTLTQYIRDLASSHSRVKIVGICFGHQIVAQALGGQVVPNNGLWEIGVSQVKLTTAGVDVFEDEDGGELIVRKQCGSLDATNILAE